MKNVFLKVGLPILCAVPLTTALTTTVLEIFNKGESKPDEISISNAPKEMLKNEELTLIVTSNPEEAYKGVTWSSSESGVISIDETTGAIKALNIGQSTITAQSDKYPDVSASCVINVVNTFEYDLTKAFEPKTQTLKGNLKLEEATSTYLKNASFSSAIIADDLAFTYYQLGYPTIGYTKITVSDLTIDVANSLISLDFHTEGNVQSTGGIMTSQDIKFKNIPVSVLYSDEPTPYATKWGVSPMIDSDWLLANDAWHYYEKDVYQTGGILEHDWDRQKLITDPQQETDILLILLGLFFSIPSLSYYLSETTPA